MISKMEAALKIFINLPTWLGDSVMASAALRLIFRHFKQLVEQENLAHLQNDKSPKNSQNSINLSNKIPQNSANLSKTKAAQTPTKHAEFTLYGSFVACELFKGLQKSEDFKDFAFQIYTQTPKDKGIFATFKRLLKLRKMAKNLGEFECAISFRSAFSARILLFFLRAKRKFCFDKRQNANAHQVLKYLAFTQNSLGVKATSDELFLPVPAFKAMTNSAKQALLGKFALSNDKKWLGINAGAKYGLAKCWEKEHFVQVALAFSDTHEILIFGVQDEAQICDFIEQNLAQNGVRAHNLCAKTSLSELCSLISALDIFVSNDSGAMHIGAAYKTPTIAVFGPTRFAQTSPWRNPRAKIVHLNLPCMPCMKRVCPLKHHACMRDLKPTVVIAEIKKLKA